MLQVKKEIGSMVLLESDLKGGMIDIGGSVLKRVLVDRGAVDTVTELNADEAKQRTEHYKKIGKEESELMK